PEGPDAASGAGRSRRDAAGRRAVCRQGAGVARPGREGTRRRGAPDETPHARRRGGHPAALAGARDWPLDGGDVPDLFAGPVGRVAGGGLRPARWGTEPVRAGGTAGAAGVGRTGPTVAALPHHRHVVFLAEFRQGAAVGLIERRRRFRTS